MLPLALAAWLIHLASPGRIVAAIALQLCIATLLLATWSPWVVLPVAFVVALAVRHRSTLRTMDARTAAPLIAAVVPPLVWLAASGPALATLGSALEIPGHGLPSVLPTVAIVLVLLVVGGVLLRSHHPNFWIALKLGGELAPDETGDLILRGFAFTAYRQYRDTGVWTTPPVEQLCDVIAAIGGPVRVITADPGLAASIEKTCPKVDARVEVTPG